MGLVIFSVIDQENTPSTVLQSCDFLRRRRLNITEPRYAEISITEAFRAGCYLDFIYNIFGFYSVTVIAIALNPSPLSGLAIFFGKK